MSTESLFEDPHTDARMRRTIPLFGCLGAGVVLLTTPLTAASASGRLQLLGVVAVAMTVSLALWWRGLIDRLPRDVVFGLLASYCVMIALAVAATGDPGSVYGFLYLLPVTFTSVFFAGWVRYSLAVAAPLIDFAVVGSFLAVDGVDRLLRLTMFLLLAHFGAVVAETLREALRASSSLHKVLEAASGAPLDGDLSSIGVEAARFVAGWDSAAVVLLRGGRLHVPSVGGLGTAAAAHYRDRPDEPVEESLIRSVIESGEVLRVLDLRRSNPGHLLTSDGIISVAAVPILFHGDIVGSLMVGHRSVRRLDDRQHDRLLRVAEQLGLALGSAAAYRREAEAAEHLRVLNRHKDEFLANVSHELRTPAAAIGLVASTLRSSADRLSDQLRQEMFETLERRARQLSELIENLLNEALADAGATRVTMADLDWTEAVQRWADVAVLETGRAVTVHLPPPPAPGRGDAVKLERVVVNLLSNAAKFSDPATPIDLHLEVDPDEVRIAVRDRGIGIAPEDRAHVFDRFHQIDGGPTRTVGGFGIGLSLTHHFVEVHGGTITVDSDLGQGSTFTVRLPRTRAEAHTVPG